MVESKAPRILVVDDESTHRILAKEYLEAAGYVVRLAEDGKRGLKLAATTKPNLILVDLMIPGIDGFELCTTLKSRPETADVPIILITASREPDVIARGLAAGVDDFVTKPVDWAYIADRVSLVISKFEDRKRALVEKDEMSRLLEVVREQGDADQLKASQPVVGLHQTDHSRDDDTEARIQAARQSAEVEMHELAMRLNAQMQAERADLQQAIEFERESARQQIDTISRALDQARAEQAQAQSDLRVKIAAEFETSTRLLKRQLDEERLRLQELKASQEAAVQAAVQSALEKVEANRGAITQEYNRRIESLQLAAEHQLLNLRAELHERAQDEKLALEARSRAGWDTMRASSYRNASSLHSLLEKLRASILASGSREPEDVARLQEVEGIARALATSIASQQFLSQMMSGQPSLYERVFDLVALAHSSIEKLRPFADQRRVILSSNLPQRPIKVVGDEQRIGYAMVCLVVNAIQHSPHGSTVSLALVDGGADGVHINIADTGVGIAPIRLEELRSCLDRPAELSGGEKIGYGIPLASAILRLHNGRLELDSRLGGGTAVRLLLPPERLARGLTGGTNTQGQQLRAS